MMERRGFLTRLAGAIIGAAALPPRGVDPDRPPASPTSRGEGQPRSGAGHSGPVCERCEGREHVVYNPGSPGHLALRKAAETRRERYSYIPEPGGLTLFAGPCPECQTEHYQQLLRSYLPEPQLRRLGVIANVTSE